MFKIHRRWYQPQQEASCGRQQRTSAFSSWRALEARQQPVMQYQYPLPPAHYTSVSDDSPPPPHPSPSRALTVFGLPLHETYGGNGEASVGRDTVSVLKKLNMTLLFEFLDFLKVLPTEPSLWEEKVESLKKSLFEMHHILNSFRPHEARESVIALLQRQVERRKATLAEVEARIQQADNILAAARDRLLTRTSTFATQHSASTQLLEEAQQQQQQRQHVNSVLSASTTQLAQATQVHNSLLAMNTYLNTLSQQYLKYGDAAPLVVNNDADAMDTS